jgi:cytochrome oxidase Cu insertion factor (SCO1/SenC/PrrC family)
MRAIRLFAVACLLAMSAQPQKGAAPQPPSEGKLAVGDLAPDFELTVRGGEQKVRLSSFRGRRPVALVFGSYT